MQYILYIYILYRSYDFESNDEWHAYLRSVEIPAGADNTAALRKLKAKWYKRNVVWKRHVVWLHQRIMLLVMEVHGHPSLTCPSYPHSTQTLTLPWQSPLPHNPPRAPHHHNNPPPQPPHNHPAQPPLHPHPLQPPPEVTPRLPCCSWSWCSLSPYGCCPCFPSGEHRPTVYAVGWGWWCMGPGCFVHMAPPS